MLECRVHRVRSVVGGAVDLQVDLVRQRDASVNAALDLGVHAVDHVRHTRLDRRARHVQLRALLVVEDAAHDVVAELGVHLQRKGGTGVTWKWGEKWG